MLSAQMRKKALALLLFIGLAGIAAAQTTVTGTVNNKAGEPQAGVTVSVVGTKNSTATNSQGAYTLNNVAANATLIFTSTGITTVREAVGNRTSINVEVDTKVNELDQVVVVGYGTARKRDITGAVVSLKAKDFNQGLISSPDQLLQNKVSGLEVTNTSGQPGVAATIQIRGNSSIRSNNNPLFVVDGVPLDGASARPNIGTTLGSTPNSNPLLFIDPNSIAQIEVLKDASSAAIYGARGANGVIVITTKKGSAGPMKMEVGTNFGVNAGYMKRFEVLDASQYRNALQKYNIPDSLGYDGGGNTDALKEITQTGFTQNYSLAFSGGNEVGKFRAAFLASNQEGFLRKTGLEKYFATIGGTYKFLDSRLTLDFNLIAGNYAEQLTSVSNTAGSEGNIISSALSWNPTKPLITNGRYNFPSSGSGNPLAFSDAYNDHSSVNAFLGNISASYKLLKNLEYKFLYGVNYGTGERKLSIDGWLKGVAAISGKGAAAIGEARLKSETFDHTLNYNATIAKDLTLNAIVGYEYFKSDYSGSNISATTFKTNLTESTRTEIPYTSTFQNAQTQQPLSTFVNPTTNIQSYFARTTFNYLDKYILNISLRADGSSKFGKNNKYGYFPAVGARWVVSNEDFMKEGKLFTNLAIRASYGITGNQEFPAGSSQEQFGLTTYTTFPQVINGNPDLKWESAKSVNVGADFAFNRGRIYASIDYYNKNTSDILFQTTAIQPAPSSISFVNLKNANLINSGVEIALGTTLIEEKDFGLDVNVNVAYNKNNVKNFTDPLTGRDNVIQTGFINGQGVSNTLAQVITNNQPVNVFFLKHYGGLDSSGNQIIGDAPAFAGDPNPKTLAGLSTSLRYKKLTFTLNFGGAFGFKIYNNTATSITNAAGLKQGRNIDQAAYDLGEATSSGVGASDRFLENGNYVKLRNATFRYNVGNLGQYVKNFSAFVSGSNLFVITKFTGFDPEVNIDKSNNSYPSRSIEYIPYPTPRVITFGFNFSL